MAEVEMVCDDGPFEGLRFTVPDKPLPLFVYEVIRGNMKVLYHGIEREGNVVICEAP